MKIIYEKQQKYTQLIQVTKTQQKSHQWKTRTTPG
jgi:hypothetical protein